MVYVRSECPINYLCVSWTYEFDLLLGPPCLHLSNVSGWMSDFQSFNLMEKEFLGKLLVPESYPFYGLLGTIVCCRRTSKKDKKNSYLIF